MRFKCAYKKAIFIYKTIDLNFNVCYNNLRMIRKFSESEGHRDMAKYVTNQRRILLEYLCTHHDELLSARAIADALAHENISISAVYRNLAELEKSGEVHRVSKSGSREVYYQYTAAGECRECLHLSCKECGKTYHMSMGAAELVTSSIAKSEMFDIDKSDTIIYGVCKGCRK